MQTMDRNLVEVRFTRIEAKVGLEAGNKRSGTLETTVKLQIGDGGDEKALATVQIDVSGVPEGASVNEAAFTISITASGVWEWIGNTRPGLKELQSEKMLFELCSSVHTLAVSEVSRLATVLGFPGVALPWTMRSETDGHTNTVDVIQKPAKRKRTAVSKK